MFNLIGTFCIVNADADREVVKFKTNLIGTFCIVNVIKLRYFPVVLENLIGTFCIVNVIQRSIHIYTPFNLIGTFCIVNFEKSRIARGYNFEFNRNILYCKSLNLLFQFFHWKNLIGTFCIVNDNPEDLNFALELI